jgi:hypothetical protein
VLKVNGWVGEGALREGQALHITKVVNLEIVTQLCPVYSLLAVYCTTVAIDDQLD